MLRSVYVRFILVNVLVVMLSVTSTAVLASRMATSEYNRVVAKGDVERYQRVMHVLRDAYAENGNWADVQSIVDYLSQISSDRIIIADGEGKVIADSAEELLGKPITANWLPRPSIISVKDTIVGYLVTMPPRQGSAGTTGAPPPQNPNPVLGRILANAGFADVINRLVLLSAGMAAIISIVFTLILTRRMLQPVRALTVAAHKMEDGDLSIRVKARSKDEIGLLAHAFNAMADSMARNEQLRRNMVNDVAHELRTPLTNLRGYLEAARDGMIQPDKQYIESLYEETMLLNRLTDDLSELALAESGQLRLVREPVNPGDLAAAALDAVRPRAEERGVTLHAEVAPGLPLTDADPARIGQVLRNLLNNALDFTPRGGEISLRVKADDHDVLTEVHDTGPGIAPEHLPFIFERFYRVDPSRARSTGGAGLGLTIVKNLVEAHGGRVWVESTVGAGSTFGFSLPRQPATEVRTG
jgi:signal transduction histidine kinase